MIYVAITSTFLILNFLVVKIQGVGCPYQLNGCSSVLLNVQKILILKSNPQNDFQDIAAVVYNPFTLGIFNFQINQQLQIIEQQENIAFYQIDKDDRPQLQASVIHTLDANSRVITWNSATGFKQSVIQLPSNITLQPNSCLNSEEMLVLTWNDSKIYIIDFSYQQNIQLDALDIDIANKFLNCFNDKMNRRFLIINQKGQLYSYDIQSKVVSLLFQISQFNSLQSLFSTQNQISISYQSSLGQNFVASFKNNTVQFLASFQNTSQNVLVNKQEDLLILIGNSNLFTIWDIKSKQIIYQADFQKIKCDHRDSNFTKVDDVINFSFGSINENDEIAVVSNQYIFVYSLLDQGPILFKSQNLQINWIQAFVVQNSVIVSQTYAVSNIDKRTSKINYLMDYFRNGQSGYDQILQVEVDNDLNRIIYSDLSGRLQIWSQIDNRQDYHLLQFEAPLYFIIDKQINKMVLYTNITLGLVIQVFDYQEVNFLQNLPFPNNTINVLDQFQIKQDKTNGYLLGFDLASTNYSIYQFKEESNFPTLYNCTLIQNGIATNNLIIILDKFKQFLLQINKVLYLFSYFPENGNTLSSSILEGQNDQFSYFQYMNSTQNLICVQDNLIQIYLHNGSQFILQNQINYYSGQSNSIFLAEAQNTLIIQRTSQIYFKNFVTQNDQSINFNNLQIQNYQLDSAKGLLICLDSSFMITQNKLTAFNLQMDMNLITISYLSGPILIYDYLANEILSSYNNYEQVLQFYYDKSQNNLILQSNLIVSSKKLTNYGLISNLYYQFSSYWIDETTGLAFILTDQIIIYNSLSQEYLPQFSVDFDISFAYAIQYIPELDFVLIGFNNNQVNLVYTYKLSSQNLLATLDHKITKCRYATIFLYDNYSNRLFTGCYLPASVIVWDLNNNFQMVKLLEQILLTSYVCTIEFHPQAGIIMMTGFSWWGVTLDYKTLQEKCQIFGIYGVIDKSHSLQITWDQNGDFRIFDVNCNQLAFQHAHTGWIQQLLIDEQNMYLTTLGYDQYVKLWNYQNITQPQLIVQISLTYSLISGLLDYDNNLILAVDFQGFIYILSYPDLTLLKQFQAQSNQIDTINLSKQFNIMTIGCFEKNSLTFYNYFEFISPNQNSVYFSEEGKFCILIEILLNQLIKGILSTLLTEGGVIFHQLGNVVQFWNYATQKLVYGFYVNSQFESYEAQSSILSLNGQQNQAVLFTRDQTIFFNTITLDIINVQQLKCRNSIQFKTYLICAISNKLTLFSLDSFSVNQQIKLNPKQGIISLQQIFSSDIFFVTTTQGEIICYSIQQNLLINNYYEKIFDQAIANYQLIQLNQFYIILVSAFDGSFGYIQISNDFNMINKLNFNLPGKSSHAHKIIYFNNNLFIKRVSDFFLGLYDISNLQQITQIKSPCMGYAYKLDLSQEYDLILQSCVGNYRINQLSTLKNIAYGRFTTKLKLAQTYTNNLNQLIFVNENYFIDAYTHQMFIYMIDYIQNQINLIGTYQAEDGQLGQVASYNIIKEQNNIFVQLLLYSASSLSQVQLPIQGDSSCQEVLSYNQISQVLLSIQAVYQQISSYFQIKDMTFTLTVNKQTYLQPLPPFAFSQISKLNIISDPALSIQQKIIVSQEFYSSFSGYDYLYIENFKVQSSQSQLLYQSLEIKNISTFVLNNIQFIDQSLFSYDINSINNLILQQLEFDNMCVNKRVLLLIGHPSIFLG
ncbi:hypothetical protein ABPG73_019689 [Tetrahymena malaccensis]